MEGGGVINGRLIGINLKKFKNLKTYIVLDLTLYAWKLSISLLPIIPIFLKIWQKIRKKEKYLPFTKSYIITFILTKDIQKVSFSPIKKDSALPNKESY